MTKGRKLPYTWNGEEIVTATGKPDVDEFFQCLELAGRTPLWRPTSAKLLKKRLRSLRHAVNAWLESDRYTRAPGRVTQ